MPPPAVRAPNGGRELQPLDYSPSPNASSSGPGPASGKPPKNSPASLGAEPDPLGEDLSARKQGGVRLKRIGSTNAAKLGTPAHPRWLARIDLTLTLLCVLVCACVCVLCVV